MMRNSEVGGPGTVKSDGLKGFPMEDYDFEEVTMAKARAGGVREARGAYMLGQGQTLFD